MDKERAYETLSRLAFERVAGTDKEIEAAHLIEEECKKMGVDVQIEEFEIPQPKVYDVQFEVTSPIKQEFYCTGIGKTGQTPKEGIEAPFVYIYSGNEEEIRDVKGKICLSTGGMSGDLRKKLVEKGPIFLIEKKETL